jgi:hypothetical protein
MKGAIVAGLWHDAAALEISGLEIFLCSLIWTRFGRAAGSERI